jgi:uncharacterized circularly permuted ATP-grasp superfamily protein/uncharacterized alpha-E superfamily protein
MTPTLRAYAAPEGHFDELRLASGEPREDWERLLAALDALGRDELQRRWREGERLIRENGVTYNVYGDPRGIDRPWQLDPIPRLVAEAEWRAIEAGVVQRATLLDRVLADVYGPQRLLKEGLLPPELVFANPGYLRPCRGLPLPPSGERLQVYAVDLARSPDGRWWALGDRTQAPSGAGYALENRIVLSRIMPEPFRVFPVQRLAGWFSALHDGLSQLSPSGDTERVVVLTPGPYNETYFEHAYLARYLGFPLVEGADLTVRDERVYLKTLGGLAPVDVILRRQDDAWCDPLELRGESTLGIPGLVQAVRAGNVAVANALGSGLVESPALLAFLPSLCRGLLGEELLLPSVATWWCGQPSELGYVAQNLERLVLKPAFPRAGSDAVFPAELGTEERAAFLARLEADPLQYVAQERIALSTAPSAAGGVDAEARHLVLRVFATSCRGRWSVMPGGLTRVSYSADSLVVSSQRGGGSKDTWVLRGERENESERAAPGRGLGPLDVQRAHTVLTSRVADNLLWLGRISERAESAMRSLRAALRQLAEEPLRVANARPPDAVALLQALGRIDAGSGTLEERTLAAIFGLERSDALGFAVRQLHRLAWHVRDQLSADAWRVLSRLEPELALPPALHPALRVSAALDCLDRSLVSLSAFSGLVTESMTRGLGWQFLDLGRRLERGIGLAELLRVGLAEEHSEEWRRLETILEVAAGAITYRSRYQTAPQLTLVLDLLLLDETNPRSLAFQLAAVTDRLERLPRAQAPALIALRERLRTTSAAALATTEEGRRGALSSLLGDAVQALAAACESVSLAYLIHALPRRQGA